MHQRQGRLRAALARSGPFGEELLGSVVAGAPPFAPLLDEAGIEQPPKVAACRRPGDAGLVAVAGPVAAAYRASER